jgi:hypothetical protein
MLKNYLRSTVSQFRLNHMVFLNVRHYKLGLGGLDFNVIQQEFVAKNDSRRKLFGNPCCNAKYKSNRNCLNAFCYFYFVFDLVINFCLATFSEFIEPRDEIAIFFILVILYQFEHSAEPLLSHKPLMNKLQAFNILSNKSFASFIYF